jgi:hypothetical protein
VFARRLGASALNNPKKLKNPKKTPCSFGPAPRRSGVEKLLLNHDAATLKRRGTPI